MSFLSEDMVRRVLRRYSIRPDRKKGQTFLVNPQVVRRTVVEARLDRDDDVLEIGGGLGTLSRALAAVARRVFVIEIDRRLVQAMRGLLRDLDNVEVIHGDALTMELPRADKVVSNLPYSISSDITFRLLNNYSFEEAVLMYQREFAHRLMARPCTGEYSRLTVNTRYFADVERLFDVPAEAFYPRPKVDSTVVRLMPVDREVRHDRKTFSWMVRGVYAHRNKHFKRALSIWFKNAGLDSALVDTVLQEIGDRIAPTDRPRCIALEDLIALADLLQKMIDEGLLEGP